ncbi:hypothetical protein WG899_04320 [Paucibacter sp. AS339]|uniref:hypothetical protein n=1 Tax=Paucibacter hankyongi TaxID=3133434 RepID=UPI0030AB6FFA
MVFLDTEFTNLEEPALLSFSMVSIDGFEIYAELDLALDPTGQARLAASSEFTRKTVIPQFGRVPQSKCSGRELGNKAGQWLLARAGGASGKITLAYDYEDDFALLRSAMLEAKIWDQVHTVLAPENIDDITSCVDGVRAAEASWLESFLYRGIERHHSLADALALRAAWRAVSGA